MEHPTIQILLATYNGEAYIQPALDSLLQQDYPNIHITVSDDCSTDGTCAILDEYARQHPERVTHYRSGIRFGCAQKHFMHLLKQYRTATYIMFCDQDDIWHSDKVSKTLAKMQETETSADTPCLVHTDLRVVDSQLQQIAPSFCRHSGLDGNRLALNQLLVQNVVTGCTVMINNQLAQLACSCEASSEMRMHDWWLALLASACGQISYLDEATIDYRQHGSNSVGAKNVHSPAYLAKRLFSTPMRRGLRLAALQAEAFLRCFGHLLDKDQEELVSAFASTKDMDLFARDRIYIKHNLLKSGFVRRFSQLTGL